MSIWVPRLVNLGVLLLSFLSGFLIEPPIEDPSSGGRTLYHFAHFLVVAVIGILIMPAAHYRKRAFSWRWWGLAFATLAGFLTAYIWFTHTMERTTILAGDEPARQVIGIRLQPAAQMIVNEEHIAAREQLLDYFPGDGNDGSVRSRIAQIWYPEEVMRNRNRLLALYLATVIMFTAFVVCLIQALRSYFGGPERIQRFIE